jgi:hypothetical protein
MDKSFLEEKIKEKAKKRLLADEKSLRELAYNHPILRKLSVVQADEDGKSKLVRIIAIDGYSNELFVAGMDENSERCDKTNINQIRKELLQKYEEQELDNILNKLDSVGYLFED